MTSLNRFTAFLLAVSLSVSVCHASSSSPPDSASRAPTNSQPDSKTPAKKPLTYEQLLEKARTGAQLLVQQTVNAERFYLQNCGTLQAFHSMAEAMIDYSEKFAQAQDAFNTGDGGFGRMEQAFRSYVLDDTQLLKRWNAAVQHMQSQLMSDTFQLFIASGRKLQEFPPDSPNLVLTPEFRAQPFDELFKAAAKVARSDWMREAATIAASFAAGSVAADLAESAGLVEEGGWASALFELAIDAAATSAIEQMHDPAGDIAKNLKDAYERVTAYLMSHNGGFAGACNYIAKQHLEFRARVLGLSTGASSNGKASK